MTEHRDRSLQRWLKKGTSTFRGARKATSELRARLDGIRNRALDGVVSKLSGRAVCTTAENLFKKPKRLREPPGGEKARRAPEVGEQPSPPPELPPARPSTPPAAPATASPRVEVTEREEPSAAPASEVSAAPEEAGRKKKKRRRRPKRRPEPKTTRLDVLPRSGDEVLATWTLEGPELEAFERAQDVHIELTYGTSAVAMAPVESRRGEVFLSVPMPGAVYVAELRVDQRTHVRSAPVETPPTEGSSGAAPGWWPAQGWPMRLPGPSAWSAASVEQTQDLTPEAPWRAFAASEEIAAELLREGASEQLARVGERFAPAEAGFGPPLGASESYPGSSEAFLGASEAFLGASDAFLGASEAHFGSSEAFPSFRWGHPSSEASFGPIMALEASSEQHAQLPPGASEEHWGHPESRWGAGGEASPQPPLGASEGWVAASTPRLDSDSESSGTEEGGSSDAWVRAQPPRLREAMASAQSGGWMRTAERPSPERLEAFLAGVPPEAMRPADAVVVSSAWPPPGLGGRVEVEPSTPAESPAAELPPPPDEPLVKEPPEPTRASAEPDEPREATGPSMSPPGPGTAPPWRGPSRAEVLPSPSLEPVFAELAPTPDGLASAELPLAGPPPERPLEAPTFEGPPSVSVESELEETLPVRRDLLPRRDVQEWGAPRAQPEAKDIDERLLYRPVPQRRWDPKPPSIERLLHRPLEPDE